MHSIILIIGGNLGNRELYLRQTAEQIEARIGKITSKSDIFESEPWGFEHSNNFLNQVLIVNTPLSALCLLDACDSIEKSLGRNRYSDKYTGRTADIDVLFYDDCVFTLPPLIVPHRLLHKRMFVLEPLEQVASDFVHPLLGFTIKELKQNCEDQGKVWKYSHVMESVAN
jgi:2-amino-4-hydroxy-6-hydroxymethyldihydropteridine diphosphokinase